MPRVIVCDVNETLLDVGALEPDFKEVFGDAHVLQDWFATVLLYSEVATLAGPYADFASIAGAALDMTAGARGTAVSSGNRTRILQGMLKLPAHSDVREGLLIMRDAGLRLVTLTNSAPAAVQQQLARSLTSLVPISERSRKPSWQTNELREPLALLISHQPWSRPTRPPPRSCPDSTGTRSKAPSPAP
jgi:FMN phosphatase YigB (HAD superfamily)